MQATMKNMFMCSTTNFGAVRSCSLNKVSSSQIHSRFSLHLPSCSLIQTPSSAFPAACPPSSLAPYWQAQVQVQVRWGSGRSESGKVQLRELKTQRFGPEQYPIFGFHHHHHPPPGTFFLAFKGSRQVGWTPRQRSSGTTGGTSGSTSMSLKLSDSFMKS